MNDTRPSLYNLTLVKQFLVEKNIMNSLKWDFFYILIIAIEPNNNSQFSSKRLFRKYIFLISIRFVYLKNVVSRWILSTIYDILFINLWDILICITSEVLKQFFFMYNITYKYFLLPMVPLQLLVMSCSRTFPCPGPV